MRRAAATDRADETAARPASPSPRPSDPPREPATARAPCAADAGWPRRRDRRAAARSGLAPTAAAPRASRVLQRKDAAIAVASAAATSTAPRRGTYGSRHSTIQPEVLD